MGFEALNIWVRYDTPLGYLFFYCWSATTRFLLVCFMDVFFCLLYTMRLPCVSTRPMNINEEQVAQAN
jgi:hypothetical protein